jgi:hypothetical protein
MRFLVLTVGLFCLFLAAFLAERAELRCTAPTACTLTSARLRGTKVTPLELQGAEVVSGTDHENTAYDYLVLQTPAGKRKMLTWYQASSGSHAAAAARIRAYVANPGGQPFIEVEDNRTLVYGICAALMGVVIGLWFWNMGLTR